MPQVGFERMASVHVLALDHTKQQAPWPKNKLTELTCATFIYILSLGSVNGTQTYQK